MGRPGAIVDEVFEDFCEEIKGWRRIRVLDRLAKGIE
jgi:hypothetical protein